LRASLLLFWYQKKALIGFLGASGALHLLFFFSGFSGLALAADLPIQNKDKYQLF
jgi:hypothetical protein|tara:strand:- start:217 stop:381 length:165 start_codon:yes stop_codon:yes gene_type:complete